MEDGLLTSHDDPVEDIRNRINQKKKKKKSKNTVNRNTKWNLNETNRDAASVFPLSTKVLLRRKKKTATKLFR